MITSADGNGSFKKSPDKNAIDCSVQMMQHILQTPDQLLANRNCHRTNVHVLMRFEQDSALSGTDIDEAAIFFPWKLVSQRLPIPKLSPVIADKELT